MTDLHQLSTSHGSIVVEEVGRGDLPILLIHGNSLSREVFRKQLGGALSRKYRLVAFDLPGHGDSSDALNASHTYTRPGLADAALDVIDLLGLREVVVVGWIFEAARLGVGIDQRWLVENYSFPLAVVNGSEDPFINLDYLEVPKYANLWEGRCHRLPGLKHAPFWEAPDVFDELLGRYIDDVATR